MKPSCVFICKCKCMVCIYYDMTLTKRHTHSYKVTNITIINRISFHVLTFLLYNNIIFSFCYKMLIFKTNQMNIDVYNFFTFSFSSLNFSSFCVTLNNLSSKLTFFPLCLFSPSAVVLLFSFFIFDRIYDWLIFFNYNYIPGILISRSVSITFYVSASVYLFFFSLCYQRHKIYTIYFFYLHRNGKYEEKKNEKTFVFIVANRLHTFLIRTHTHTITST